MFLPPEAKWRYEVALCMDSLVAQWLVSSGVDSHLTLDWLKWHYYHVCIANGFPGGQSWVGNMRLACQLEVRTHMSQTRGPILAQINPDTS